MSVCSFSFIEMTSYTFSSVSPTRFGFAHKVEPLLYVHICGGRGWDKGDSTYLQNGGCRVESNAKIVKAGFHYFRSFLDQNALLKGSQTSRKCAQEFSSGKEWVLRCLQDTFGGRSATAKLPLNNRARTTILYMNALWSWEKGKLSSYCISCLVL